MGINGLARRLLWAQIVLLAVTAPLYPLLGLSFDWRTIIPFGVALCALAGLWLYHRWTPASPSDWIIAEVLLAVFLIILLTNIVSPAQYAAVALRRPLVDPWLAAADRTMGVYVPALAAWTRAHQMTSRVLNIAYFTLLPQFVVPFAALGVILRDRESLWEYIFHFHFCGIITLAALAVFPAECAFSYYGFQSTIDQSHFIRQFQGFRNGSLKVIGFDDLDGLISMPSFHMAGGLMVTWVFRRYRWLFVPLAMLNAALVASTVLSGAHYFVDLVATAVLFWTSGWAYRRWGAAWLRDA